MSDNFKLIATGYLYSPWAGKLREFAGEVYHRDKILSPNGIIQPERSYFIIKDKHGRTLKKLDCAASEGEIHNKVVWLQEQNARKAAGILIEYEETQIAKLRLQIENHECLIETLKSI